MFVSGGEPVDGCDAVTLLVVGDSSDEVQGRARELGVWHPSVWDDMRIRPQDIELALDDERGFAWKPGHERVWQSSASWPQGDGSAGSPSGDLASPRLRPELVEQLARVPKSTDGYVQYAPCRLTLRSGAVLDRVYVVEESSFRRIWGSAEARVSIEDVNRIEESPFRLPPTLADKLYKAGESGMGYTVFMARMRGGALLPFVVGNAVDFPNWPPGVDPRDVLDVEPHAGRTEFRDRVPATHESSANYEWCLFSR